MECSNLVVGIVNAVC